MKKKLITSAFLIGSYIAASLAFGQDIQLKGAVFSKSATLPAGESSVVLYNVPQNKKLIVTQYCRRNELYLSGSKLGQVPANAMEDCTTYVPGVLFKPGESLICTARFLFNDDSVCLINGVIKTIQ